MMIFLCAGIIVVIVLIALTYRAVVTKDYGPNPLDEIQHLSNMAAELAETAGIYREMGMHEDAEAAMAESQRLSAMVWNVINGKDANAEN